MHLLPLHSLISNLVHDSLGGTPCFTSVAPCRIQMLGSETMACGAESIMRNEDCMVVQLPFCVMHLELRAMGEPSYSPLLNPALLSLEQMFS